MLTGVRLLRLVWRAWSTTPRMKLSVAAAELRPGLPVVFASGYSENELVTQGRLDPEVRLLNKPYRRADLDRVLSEVLGDVRG